MNDNTTTVAELRQMIAEFVADRDWNQFHDAKNLTQAMAIELGELMEHFQWLRSDQLGQVRESPEQMQAVREELADVAWFLISFANAMDIDLSKAMEDKMVKNRQKYPADKFKGRFR
jgi:NTP pyrophosphatase (non-canonical NTP hydrolase)